MATIHIPDVNPTRSYPGLEAALSAVGARPYHQAPEPGRPLASYADMGGGLFAYTTELRDSSEISRTEAVGPDGATRSFAGLLQGEGLRFRIEGRQRGSRSDIAMWAPGAPPEVRVQRRKSIPGDIEDWIGASDEVLAQKLLEHFFASV